MDARLSAAGVRRRRRNASARYWRRRCVALRSVAAAAVARRTPRTGLLHTALVLAACPPYTRRRCCLLDNASDQRPALPTTPNARQPLVLRRQSAPRKGDGQVCRPHRLPRALVRAAAAPPPLLLIWLFHTRSSAWEMRVGVAPIPATRPRAITRQQHAHQHAPTRNHTTAGSHTSSTRARPRRASPKPRSTKESSAPPGSRR